MKYMKLFLTMLVSVVPVAAPNLIVDARVKNDFGETPLFDAVRYGNWSTINALLDAGADINFLNRASETPLDIVKYGDDFLQEGGDAVEDTALLEKITQYFIVAATGMPNDVAGLIAGYTGS